MNKPTEIQSLLGQVRQAADKLKTRIHALDEQIEALFSQRSAIVSGPLSKADYLAAIRADIQAKARPFAVKLRRHLDKVQAVAYPAVAQASAGGLSLRYLDAGLTVYEGVPEDGYYFYFEDAIVAGVERALEGRQWPDHAAPSAERKQALAGIAAQIDALTAERDALAGELISCGLTQ